MTRLLALAPLLMLLALAAFVAVTLVPAVLAGPGA